MRTRRPTTLVLAGLLTLGGCASSQSPVLYPNTKLKQVGSQQAGRDIEECRKLADEYVQSTAAKDVAKGTAVGGAAGAAIGAVGGAAAGAVIGAIAGDPGKGAAIGAVTGAVGGGAIGGTQQYAKSKEGYEKAFAACMSGRGYSVSR